MKHLFIPYELAIIAKEKGFNEPCLAMYSQPEWSKEVILTWQLEGSILGPDDGPFYNAEGVPLKQNKYVAAPLYQQIVDWLREEHKIHICNNPHFTTSGGVAGYLFDVYSFSSILGYQENSKTIAGTTHYETLDKAITWAFNLIK